MALQSSNNPVFARSAPLIESLRGAPTADQVAEVYGTPQRLTLDDIMVKTGSLLGLLVLTGAITWALDLGFGVVVLAALVGFGLAMVNILSGRSAPGWSSPTPPCRASPSAGSATPTTASTAASSCRP